MHTPITSRFASRFALSGFSFTSALRRAGFGTAMLASALFIPEIAAAPKPPEGVPAGARWHKKARLWVVDAKGKRTVYFANGKTRAEGGYKDKKRTGTWKFYFPDGKLQGTGRFIANRLEGQWKLYYRSGRMKAQGKYKNNYRQGKWIYYNFGKKKSEGLYEDGFKHGPWTEYYGDGNVFYRGSFKLGKAHGAWKYFTRKGKLVQSGEFRNGARWGKWYVCVMGQCGHKYFKASNTPRRSGLRSPGAKRRADDLLKRRRGPVRW